MKKITPKEATSGRLRLYVSVNWAHLKAGKMTGLPYKIEVLRSSTAWIMK